MSHRTAMTIALGATLLTASLIGPASARSSDCSSMPGSTQPERNKRYLCRAVADRHPGTCSSISGDNDLRHLCEAQAGNDSGRCSSISNAGGRAFCRGVSGDRR